MIRRNELGRETTIVSFFFLLVKKHLTVDKGRRRRMRKMKLW